MRGFCSACGSFLFFRDETVDEIKMCVGCFDKEALADYGRVLTYAEKHLFCEREITSVTDRLPGQKYKYGCKDGDVILLRS